jgi:hypothetical protein
MPNHAPTGFGLSALTVALLSMRVETPTTAHAASTDVPAIDSIRVFVILFIPPLRWDRNPSTVYVIIPRG